MILKSACSNNPSYIDRLISVFMRSLQKMVREHLSPQAASGSTEAASGDALGRAASGPLRLAAPLRPAFVFIIICSQQRDSERFIDYQSQVLFQNKLLLKFVIVRMKRF